MPARFVREGNRLRPYIAISFNLRVPSTHHQLRRARNPICEGGPEQMNCCVLRLPSKPSGECVDELYVIPSTVYNVWMELTKYPRASPCKNFPDNECCKSPDDSPSDYPIIGPSGLGVIFDQPQQNRSPEAFQDGKPYNRGWEGSNNNVGSNVPNFFTCSSLKRSLGLC